MGEGVTVTIANLGVSLANHSGIKVLLVDANLRDASLSRIFKLSNDFGLADILTGRAEMAGVIQEVSPNLRIIPSGKTQLNPLNVLGEEKIKEVLSQAKTMFDVVLVDCADLKNCQDSVVMAGHVDVVVLVIAEGKTRRQVIETVVAALRGQALKLKGTILNNRTYVIPRFVYERV
jgi:capsular exopolysaccharide synthesis family protein